MTTFRNNKALYGIFRYVLTTTYQPTAQHHHYHRRKYRKIFTQCVTSDKIQRVFFHSQSWTFKFFI